MPILSFWSSGGRSSRFFSTIQGFGVVACCGGGELPTSVLFMPAISAAGAEKHDSEGVNLEVLEIDE
jgi:hypothetical protein